jgi:hypothetical protein
MSVDELNVERGKLKVGSPGELALIRDQKAQNAQSGVPLMPHVVTCGADFNPLSGLLCGWVAGRFNTRRRGLTEMQQNDRFALATLATF